MKDLIRKVLGESIKKINEAEEVKYSPCETEFGGSSIQKEFCRAVATKFNRSPHRGKFKKVFFDFIGRNKEDLIFKVEDITQSSEIYQERYKEVTEIAEKLNNNCPSDKIISVVDEIFDNSIKKGVLYYIQNDGKYSLYNKFDSSYAPQAVLITKWMNTDRQPSLFSEYKGKMGVKERTILADELSNQVLNDNQLWETILPEIMGKMFLRSNLVNNSGAEFLKIVDNVLKQNQDYGAELENEFINQLQSLGYEVLPTSEQYGFVDMFLGIDFIFWSEKLNVWIPAQIKRTLSSSSQLDKLGCRYYLKGTKAKFGNQNQYISNSPF